MRDAVLEGPKPEEIEALISIATGKQERPRLSVALRLRAKGWIDMANGAYLVTLAGRALIDRSLKQPRAA